MVFWSESALDDLQGVEIYLARRSAGYARTVIASLFTRGDELSRQPRIGPVVRGYESQGLREIYENPYRLIYRIVADRVEIIAVIHASRRLPKTLRDPV